MPAQNKNKKRNAEPESFSVYKNPVHLAADRPEVFECSTDRAERVLLKYVPKLVAKSGWVAPLGLLLTFLSVLVSASFKESLGLSADTWHAVFVLGCFISLGWLVYALVKAYCAREVTIENIATKLYSDKAS